MATTIVNPNTGGGGSNPFSTIDNAFNSIYSMFGSSANNPSGVSGPNLFGSNLSTAANPFGSNPNNPQNIAAYSTYGNELGAAGSSLLGEGGSLVGTGTGVVGGGLGITEAGLQSLQPAMSYYAQLLSGDPAATTAALAPTAANLSTIESGALTRAGQGGPQGGYNASVKAGMPQWEAAQVGNAALQQQQLAAQGLSQDALAMAGVGQGVSSTGLGLGGLGASLTGQGTSALQNTILDALQKVSLNYQYGGPQTFATIMQGIGNLLGGARGLVKPGGGSQTQNPSPGGGGGTPGGGGYPPGGIPPSTGDPGTGTGSDPGTGTGTGSNDPTWTIGPVPTPDPPPGYYPGGGGDF